MQTISSDKSLLLWEQNRNGSNITQVLAGFLEEDYLDVFTQLKEFAEKEGPKKEFIKAWHEVCSAAEVKIRKKLKEVDSRLDLDTMNLVTTKFRGNVGEIMAEKSIELFGTVWDLIPGSYVTVDPQHEMFLDGEAKHLADGLPVGVQVKNYSDHGAVKNPVRWETFIKSMAMTNFWLQDEKRIAPEKLQQFLSIPRQVIWSFTPVQFDELAKQYAGSVRFIGPKEIEKKLDLKRKPYVFQQICEEIEKASSSL